MKEQKHTNSNDKYVGASKISEFEKEIYKRLQDHQKYLQDRYDKEYERIWKIYRFLAGALTLIIVIGIGFIYYQYGDNIKSMEDRIKSRTKIVGDEVSKKIESEFANPKISDLIKLKAEEAATKLIDPNRIKQMVDDLAEKRINVELEAYNKSLSELKIKTQEAHIRVAKLSELALIVSEAEFDINSLRKLKRIATSESPSDKDIRLLADISYRRLINGFRDTHETISSDISGFGASVDDWYFGVTATDGWSRENFENYYMKVSDDRKVVYVYKFWHRPKFDNSAKLLFSYFILQFAKRPDVIFTICTLINKEYQINKCFIEETGEYLKFIESKIKINNP